MVRLGGFFVVAVGFCFFFFLICLHFNSLQLKIHAFIHIQTVSPLFGKIRETFPNSVQLS